MKAYSDKIAKEKVEELVSKDIVVGYSFSFIYLEFYIWATKYVCKSHVKTNKH